MKILVVEDDFASRTVMQKIASKYGACDVAVNGAEALLAFESAYSQGEPYALVLLDIMMPGMDGHEVLAKIRAFEEEWGVTGLDGVKVIMVTALGDFENIMKGFRGQCEAYIVKPIQENKLVDHLRDLKLI